jgi:integrase
MVLLMSRPSKDPKTGIFRFRKRVPDDLRPLVGKGEEKTSLGTRDPGEAKILHAQVLAQVEERWQLLRAGVHSLNEKQATAIAGEIYRSLVAQHEDNPSRMSLSTLLFDYARHQPKKVKITPLGTNREKTQQAIQKQLERSDERMRKFADEFLAHKGLRLDETSMKMVLARVTTAAIQAQERILKMAGGDYSPDPNAQRFPPFEMPQPKRRPERIAADSKFHLVRVFEDYAKEKSISRATYNKWRPIIEKVAAEVPDCRELTKEWVIEWKDKLLRQGLTQVHVKGSYVAALKTVCTWGVANARLAENPCATVTVSVPRKIVFRSRSFTASEAASILAATLRPQPARMTKEMQSAHRWVPWLCAYTGARVGEISQLRKQDVQLHDGHWLIWITPEAGSTKDSHPRFVALHPHVLEQGFIDFIQSRPNGPIFYDKKLARLGEEAKHPQHKKVGEKLCKWIRSKEVGVTDSGVQPNHGWRHTFKTKARGVSMDAGIRDYMQGHVPATDGEGYGEHPPEALAREIAKLPRFQVNS